MRIVYEDNGPCISDAQVAAYCRDALTQLDTGDLEEIVTGNELTILALRVLIHKEFPHLKKDIKWYCNGELVHFDTNMRSTDFWSQFESVWDWGLCEMMGISF